MEIALQTMTDYDATLRLARWCEQNGVAALAVADHYLSGRNLESPALDQLVVLGGIARETSRLELCTLVSPLTFRHPAVHLKAAVTLDQMSGGRFTLGVGAGWMEEEHDAFGLELYPMGERFDRLAETLGYLRAAMDGSGSGFSGAFYRLGMFDPEPRPTNLRLVVGGGGAKRTPDLAGRYADEFNLFPSESPWTDRMERARASFRSASRDGELLISTAFPAMTGSDDAEYRSALKAHAGRFDRDPDSVAERYSALGIPHGPIDEVRDALDALAGMGITRAYLQTGGDVDTAIRQAELFMDAARR